MKLFKIEKDSSKAFWVSHILVVLATILGVYLAAISGFEQAVKFEEVVSNKNGYYLEHSMLDELKDNVEFVEEVGQNYLSGTVYFNKQSEMHLNDFVWSAMKFSPETFSIPSEILTSVRRYYHSVNIVFHDITHKRANALSKKSVKQLLEESTKLKKEIFPKINAHLKELKDTLQQQGITL